MGVSCVQWVNTGSQPPHRPTVSACPAHGAKQLLGRAASALSLASVSHVPVDVAVLEVCMCL